MGRCVVFVDGEYLRKIFSKRNLRVDVPAAVRSLLEAAGVPNSSLLRVYYYTSPPYQSSSPTDDEKQRYKSFQRFVHFLENQESFEVRLGRLEKRGASYNQKMVDVLMSIDLVELSAKETIDTAIVVAGDSDFVPAIQKAKNNGTKVILACSSDIDEYHLELWKVADMRIRIDESMMRGCSSGSLGP